MRLSLLSVLAMLSLAPQLVMACTVYDTNYKNKGSVQSNMVLNSAWKIVGSISGNMVVNSSTKIVGSLVGESIIDSKGSISGQAVKPNIYNSGYQMIGYGADCTNIELAAVKLLAF